MQVDIRDGGLIPGSGRSPGEGHRNPLQHCCYRIPWTEEPGRLQSIGWHRVRYHWKFSTYACKAAYMHNMMGHIMHPVIQKKKKLTSPEEEEIMSAESLPTWTEISASSLSLQIASLPCRFWTWQPSQSFETIP